MRQNPHGGDIYTKKCRVDFSVNVNPLGTPESDEEADEEERGIGGTVS